MNHMDKVTFGASGLDRAVELRRDPDRIAALGAGADARCVLFWRGKPLVDHVDGAALARLPMDHPVLAGAAPLRVFVGLDRGAPLFVRELVNWTPEDVDFSTLGAFLDPSEQRHPLLPGDERFAELRAVMTALGPRDAEIAASVKAVLGWHESHRFCSRCGSPSVAAPGGWQRDCPACGGHHFPRTDPVVIMLITHGNALLVGRAAAWPEGMYSLLAGFMEPGETIEAAVRREVFEETAIEVGEVRYLASQPWPFPSSVMIGCIGEAKGREITLDPHELEDALWISREELAQVFAGQHPRIRASRKGAIAHYLMWNWLADRLK
jgi:NAD+ diphosphatase